MRVVTDAQPAGGAHRLRNRRDDVGGAIEEALVAALDEARCRRRGAIVVSDYLKGVVTRARDGALVAAGAAARGMPVLVDPKMPHIDYYAGATLVTPNHHEAESATHMRIRTNDDARRRAARRFARALRVRRRADHPRRTRHVAVAPSSTKATCRRRRAKCRT